MIDVRVTTLENVSVSIKESLARIEGRFDKVDQELKEVRVELRGDIKEVRMELKTDIQRNFLGSLAAFIGVLGLIAHAFKWI